MRMRCKEMSIGISLQRMHILEIFPFRKILLSGGRFQPSRIWNERDSNLVQYGSKSCAFRSLRWSSTIRPKFFKFSTFGVLGYFQLCKMRWCNWFCFFKAKTCIILSSKNTCKINFLLSNGLSNDSTLIYGPCW